MAQPLSFDRVADRYDDTRGYPPGVPQRIADGLVNFGGLAPGAHALEVGIGTGRIALPLLARGISITGVDISPKMTERLRAKYEALGADHPGIMPGALDIRIGEVSALPFADGAFDAALAVHVFHLVADWRQALDETLRVIRPGGVFLLGQDEHAGAEDSALAAIQAQWQQIIRDLGLTTSRYSGKGYSAVVEDLRARGLLVEERVVATWESTRSPYAMLAEFRERTWSRTWSIPDDVYAQSLGRLEDWLRARFGDNLGTPLHAIRAFKVARVRR